MNVNGYEVSGDLQTTNGGNCKWGFAQKGGRRYFIKELLNPVYPTDDVDIAENLKERKRQACRKFEERQAQLYNTLNIASEGALVHVNEFFRCGSKYYITMPVVQGLPQGIRHSGDFSGEDRIRVCRTLIHSIGRMHKAGLIHGDLKPDNILLERTPAGHVTAKVIDFEDCYWTEESPKPGEDIRGDMIYLAPETFRLMCEENIRLTQAIDVYALGLVLHEILTGEFPRYDKKYTYPFEALVNGEKLQILPGRLPGPFLKLIPLMLAADPAIRITLDKAEEMLGGAPSYQEYRPPERSIPPTVNYKTPTLRRSPVRTPGMPAPAASAPPSGTPAGPAAPFGTPAAPAVPPTVPGPSGVPAGRTTPGSAMASSASSGGEHRFHMEFTPPPSGGPSSAPKLRSSMGKKKSSG